MTETFGRTITQEIYNKRYSISITIIISRYKQIFDTEKPITSTACIIDQFNGFNQTQSAENKLESTCIYVTSHILCTLHQTIQTSLPWSHFIWTFHNFKGLFILVGSVHPIDTALRKTVRDCTCILTTLVFVSVRWVADFVFKCTCVAHIELWITSITWSLNVWKDGTKRDQDKLDFDVYGVYFVYGVIPLDSF